VGGSDPSCGAGVQADLQTLNLLRVPARCVVSALTAQNEKEFFSTQLCRPKNFIDQFKSLNFNGKESILKVGMLGHFRLVEILLNWMVQNKAFFSILDPVFKSSTGAALIDPKGLSLLRKNLFLFDLLTPNIHELEVLSGRKIKRDGEVRGVAEIFYEEIKRQNPKFHLLVKGGHLQKTSTDFLFTPQNFYSFPAPLIPLSSNVHGTGCSLASALAAYLAQGLKMKEAARKAKDLVRKKILNHQKAHS